MIAPVTRLRKKEIDYLGTHRCLHGHTYLEHYPCYLSENPLREKLGFFDIEAYSYGRAFRAEDGIIFCYCIKEMGKEKIYTGVNTKKEILKRSDKKVCMKMIKDLGRFHKIFGYNSTRYDIPYSRTRCLINRLEFPQFGEIYHRDIMYIARSKFSLKRCTQENVGRVLLGKSNKTHFSPSLWASVFQGHTKNMLKIVDHCKRDVIELEQIYNISKKYTKRNSKSI